MNLDEILHEFSSKHYTSSLGTPTHRIGDFDEAKADILNWVLKQIPEKKEEFSFTYGGCNPDFNRGFNQAIDDIKAKFKESE